MALVLGYYGGKALFVKELLSIFPPSHHTYVEVFGGGAALLLNKPPSAIEVYNDIDENVVAFFRCMKDEEKMKQLLQYLLFTPFSRREARRSQKAIIKGETVQDEIARAGRWFTAVYQGFSYKITGWTYAIGVSRNAVARATASWRGKMCKLHAIHYRLRNVRIECMDFEDVIQKYDSEDTLFYCDPPYVHETRKNVESYLFEMTDDEHMRFLECATRIKGRMIISNYPNRIYEKYLSSWHKHCFRAVAFASNSRVVGNKAERTEVAWTNYIHQPRLEVLDADFAF